MVSFAWRNLLTRPLRTALALVGLSVPILGRDGPVQPLGGAAEPGRGHPQQDPGGDGPPRERPQPRLQRPAGGPGAEVGQDPGRPDRGPRGLEDRPDDRRGQRLQPDARRGRQRQVLPGHPRHARDPGAGHRRPLPTAERRLSQGPAEGEGGGRYPPPRRPGQAPRRHQQEDRRRLRRRPGATQEGRGHAQLDTIKGEPFTIIGIYETGSMFLDVVLVMDISVARRVLGVAPDTVSSYYVEMDDPSTNDAVAARDRGGLRRGRCAEHVGVHGQFRHADGPARQVPADDGQPGAAGGDRRDHQHDADEHDRAVRRVRRPADQRLVARATSWRW